MKKTKMTAGFTLVELIVVIAILGILAGVGTVGYSGYIKKANQTADEQLASSVANALQLGYYSNIGEDFSGYVVLSRDAAPSVADGTISGAVIEECLKAAFGEDLSGMTLKYDGWVVDSDMLNAAISGNPAAVANSSYVKNSSVSELLGNVQTVTSAASEVLGGKARSASHLVNLLKTTLGDGYLEKAADAGVLKKDGSDYTLVSGTYTENGDGTVTLSNELQNQLSNMMVFSVADQLKEASTEEMRNLMLVGVVDGATIPDGYSEATALAARYALFKAYAVDNGKEADFEELNNKLLTANEDDGSGKSAMDKVQDAFTAFVDDNSAGMETYLMNADGTDFSAAFNDNANAVASIMGGVNSVESNYATADKLASGSLYTSGGVANDLGTYINMAGLAASGMDMSAISGVSGGMLISVGAGDVAVIASAN